MRACPYVHMESDDVCKECHTKTVTEIRGAWVCVECGLVSGRVLCDEEPFMDDEARAPNLPAPFSAHALDPMRLFVSGACCKVGRFSCCEWANACVSYACVCCE
jgi:hypothetical protein